MAKEVVEYFDDTHTYCVNGVIVPSVSKLVLFALGDDMYSRVPPEVLKKARIRGSEVHSAIEEYELNRTPSDAYPDVLESYEMLKKKYLLYVDKMEQIVNYGKHYCGRYDILDKEGTLWDIKTTYKINKEYLAWQLGLYYLALGVEKEVGYCLWIPKKGKPKVELIRPHSNKECKDLVEMFERAQSEVNLAI